LIDVEPLAKLNGCRVKYLKDAYIEIAKRECIKANMEKKNPPYLPLEKVINTHMQFRNKQLD